MEHTPNNLGAVIRQLREERRYSRPKFVEHLAEHHGLTVTRQALKAWEDGTTPLRVDKAETIAKALGVPLWRMLKPAAPTPVECPHCGCAHLVPGGVAT